LILARQYFRLFPETIFVPGPVSGALYLLLAEKVFSLDGVRSNILKLTENNLPLDEVSHRVGLPDAEIRAFLSALEDTGAGFFADHAYCVEKIRPFNPIEDITFFRPAPQLNILHITPTWSCSGKCGFCHGGEPIPRLQPCLGCQQKNTEDNSKLTIPLIDKAIGESACLGCRSLVIHSGSPDCSADLITETILTAREYGYTTIQLVSGCPVPEKFLKHLILLETTPIFQIFSDSGPIHDKVAGEEASFLLLMRNISILKAEGFPFKLVYLYTGEEPEPQKVFSNLQTLNPGEVYADRLVRPDSETGCALGAGEHAPGNGDFLYGPASLLPPDIVKYVSGVKRQNCLNGRLALNPDGYFYPCPVSLQYKMGHVSETTVQDLFAEEILQGHWHDSSGTGEICERCEFYFACHRCKTTLYSQQGKCLYGYEPDKGEWK